MLVCLNGKRFKPVSMDSTNAFRKFKLPYSHTHKIFVQPNLVGAKQIHKNVCRVLLAAYESLQAAFTQGLDRLAREKKNLSTF